MTEQNSSNDKGSPEMAVPCHVWERFTRPETGEETGRTNSQAEVPLARFAQLVRHSPAASQSPNSRHHSAFDAFGRNRAGSLFDPELEGSTHPRDQREEVDAAICAGIQGSEFTRNQSRFEPCELVVVDRAFIPQNDETFELRDRVLRFRSGPATGRMIGLVSPFFEIRRRRRWRPIVQSPFKLWSDRSDLNELPTNHLNWFPNRENNVVGREPTGHDCPLPSGAETKDTEEGHSRDVRLCAAVLDRYVTHIRWSDVIPCDGT